MEYADRLEILAEVGVAFVGFTGVVIALLHGSSQIVAISQTRQIRLLLYQALIVVLFSLFPFVLEPLGWDSSIFWRFNNALLASINGLLTWYAVYSHFKIWGSDVGFFRRLKLGRLLHYWGLLTFLIPIALAILSLQILNVVGLLEAGASVFLGTLIWLLAMSGLNFLHLLSGLLTQR